MHVVVLLFMDDQSIVVESENRTERERDFPARNVHGSPLASDCAGLCALDDDGSVRRLKRSFDVVASFGVGRGVLHGLPQVRWSASLDTRRVVDPDVARTYALAGRFPVHVAARLEVLANHLDALR